MTDNPTTSTILFADICRSSFLFDQLGDETALELIMEALKLAGHIATQLGGGVIGTIGDEVLCTFDSPADALLAANQIHLQIQQNIRAQQHQLAMRIGINRGPVVKSDGNIWGDTVNTAARLAQQAKAHQTLTSADTIASLDKSFTEQIRLLGQVSLHGKAGMIEVYEFLALEAREEITDVATIAKTTDRSYLLKVRYRTRRMRFDPLLVRFLFGRSVNCDQVIDHPTISREHAEILYRNGQFVLRDFSTNGSFIVQEHQTKRLRRASLDLKGSGKIYLGQTLHNHDLCIEFTCIGHR